MARALFLAGGVVVLALVFTWGLPLPAGSEAHRQAVLWGLPAAVLLLSLFGVRGVSRPRVRPPSPSPPWRRRSAGKGC